MVNKGRAREYAIQIIIPECQRICRMKNDEALDYNGNMTTIVTTKSHQITPNSLKLESKPISFGILPVKLWSLRDNTAVG